MSTIVPSTSKWHSRGFLWGGGGGYHASPGVTDRGDRRPAGLLGPLQERVNQPPRLHVVSQDPLPQPVLLSTGILRWSQAQRGNPPKNGRRGRGVNAHHYIENGVIND